MSVRTCTVICPCGPNGEPLRCGYKPGHKGAHSYATLPTFVKPANDGGPLEIHPGRSVSGFTGTVSREGIAVLATREWWAAACASLGDDFPHVANIRAALSAGSGGRETTP